MRRSAGALISVQAQHWRGVGAFREAGARYSNAAALAVLTALADSTSGGAL